MSVLARLFAGVILALCLALPAAAVQPRGSAAWSDDGWASFSGNLYHGPGVQYPVTGHIVAGIRIRVDRCQALWCLIHTKGAIGWIAFQTDDCRALYEELQERGVSDFSQEPTDHFYGTDMGVRDPFGNHIRILQPAQQNADAKAADVTKTPQEATA